MVSASKWTNNNKSSGGSSGAGPGAACSQCVTVINVCPSPGHTLLPGGHNQITHPSKLQHKQQLPPQHGHHGGYNEPPYENLSFHKVTINVPDVGDGVEEDAHQLYTEKPRVLLRKPPLRKSKVPLKYQGIKRVKSKSKTQKHEHSSSHHVGSGLDKTGYSQKEVWNWLYLEEAAKKNGFNIETYDVDGDQGDGEMAPDKSVSVQFSPVEFLQATNRLAHLNLEGFERFVGNTIDRALAGARAKSSDVLDPRGKDKENFNQNQSQILDSSSIKNNEPIFKSDRDTDDVYVGKDPNHNQSPQGCGCKSKVRSVCDSCLRSGESSCSSALSSLESVKSSLSQGPRSRESDGSVSARGSYLSSESGTGTAGTGVSQDYMRMSGPTSGHNIYRGKIRASLPVGGPSHKPYQTLEVSPDQGMTFIMFHCTCDRHM